MAAMTESDWLISRKPAALVRKVRRTASGRKLQLYMCGVCRLVWHLIPNDVLRHGVEAVERLVDEALDPSEYLRLMDLAKTIGFRELGVRNIDYTASDFAAYVVQATLSYEMQRLTDSVLDWGRAANRLAVPVDHRLTADTRFDQSVCELIRDLFPPLGRGYERQPDGRILLPDGTRYAVPENAIAIARGIVDDQAYDRLPILADALEDANLADRRWLDHLRFGEQHWRGCWAVDTVFGK
jgi:hypothetical protein